MVNKTVNINNKLLNINILVVVLINDRIFTVKIMDFK